MRRLVGVDLHVGVGDGLDFGPLGMLADHKWLAASEVSIGNL